MKRKFPYILLFFLFTGGFVFAQPKRYVPYGGQRLESTRQGFSITRAELYGNTVRVNFSSPVAPSSITKNDIYVDGKKIADSAVIKFDRSGKSVEITCIQMQNANVIEFKKALSFNKEILSPNKIKIQRF